MIGHINELKMVKSLKVIVGAFLLSSSVSASAALVDWGDFKYTIMEFPSGAKIADYMPPEIRSELESWSEFCRQSEDEIDEDALKVIQHYLLKVDSRTPTILVVAYYQDLLCGAMTLTKDDAGLPWVNGLAKRPSGMPHDSLAPVRGVGKALLCQAIRISEASGHGGLISLQSTCGATDFYEEFGFRQTNAYDVEDENYLRMNKKDAAACMVAEGLGAVHVDLNFSEQRQINSYFVDLVTDEEKLSFLFDNPHLIAKIAERGCQLANGYFLLCSSQPRIWESTEEIPPFFRY